MSTIAEKASNAGKLVRQLIGSALSSVHAGDVKMVSRQSDRIGEEVLTLSSSAFLNASPIPTQHTPQGANISPDLSWTGVPAQTRELVLIVEDPDAPMPQPFVHWIMHRIPPTVRSLPAGLPAQHELPQLHGAVQGENDAKTRGWYGPKPPLGHGVHHYHFQLFAVDTQLSLGPDATLSDLSNALRGHVLADGEIVGTYELTADSNG
jgi:Raf kinase inhibitor-like YbhB/YbcL family protein